MAGHEREKRADFIRKLNWADFRRVPKSLDGIHDANTATRISCRYEYVTSKNEGTWRIRRVHVTLTLDARNTWVVHGKEHSALLAHEQRHYDIAAIAARTLRAKLAALHGNVTRNAATVIDQTISDVIGNKPRKGGLLTTGMLQEVQSRYDEDVQCGTDHGLNSVKQAMWNVRIRETLNEKSATLETLDSCPRLRVEEQNSGE